MSSSTIDHDLTKLLDGLDLACNDHASWRGGQIELDVELYFTDRPPPAALTSSGRCIVLTGSQVLVMSNPGGEHILPGGRMHPGEALVDATIREVAEETGLAIADPVQVGVLVFHHRTPRPEVYRYPYPIFLNAVFVANAQEPQRLVVNDTYELDGQFVDTDLALARIPAYQRVLLRESVRANWIR